MVFMIIQLYQLGKYLCDNVILIITICYETEDQPSSSGASVLQEVGNGSKMEERLEEKVKGFSQW